MNENSNVIIALCSYLSIGEDVSPLSPKEYSDLAKALLDHNLKPKDLLTFTNDDYSAYLNYDIDKAFRIKRLLDRMGSLAFEIEGLNSKGIKIVTRADKEYPSKLKKILKHRCPPLFYYVGNLDLLNNNLFGFTGSRSIMEIDTLYTKSQVEFLVKNNYTICSGGAKGVDQTASETALTLGGSAVEFLSAQLDVRMKNPLIIKALMEDRALLISSVIPSARFMVGTAMERNKYIYASSKGTLVIKSDYKKGGTWSGAVEALKHGYNHVLCWNNPNYQGNLELIKLGAVEIDTRIDLDLLDQEISPKVEEKPKKEKIEQLKLF